jgi:YidC/Oxa1 family membrane protein insertase
VEPGRSRLRRAAEGFPLILASPLTPLEDVLRSILEWLGPHGTLGLSWAWSIVALTVLVRMLLVPLTVKQIHSMQAMQAHMPEMKAIQQRFKHDKQKRNEELMKFYRENNVNPAAPCLPLLFQFPVFIALYLVLRHSDELIDKGDQVSWLGLIPDITHHANAHWSGYLLLVIYVASQLASTYFMSATMDKTQRTMMMILPVAFVPVLVNFPVGLVLYWVTTNLWTVGQGVVTRQLVPKKPPPAPKRSSRTPPRAEESGDGAKEGPVSPEPAPAAAPRRVKRKKKKARR